MDSELASMRNPYAQAVRWANHGLMSWTRAPLSAGARRRMVHNARTVELGHRTPEAGHLREVPILVSEARRHLRSGQFRYTGMFLVGAIANGTVAPLFAPSMQREARIPVLDRSALHAADGSFPGALSQADFGPST
jgi:hypothetical protein